MTPSDPELQRANLRDTWETAAAAWGRRADRVREWGMPVSVAMLEALALRPGDRVLELAAGPGDTGFMAAEQIRTDSPPAPGTAGHDGAQPVAPGTLLSSDGAETMLDVARQRARDAGVQNVEFRQLELEWIDLPTASVDAVLCRWGIMLTVDPDAAAREIRRVLSADGRAALAVWDRPERNPWATVPRSVLVDLGHAQPPDPGGPDMFSLADEGRLADLLGGAGFTEVEVSTVTMERHYASVDQFIDDQVELSPGFGIAFRALDDTDQAEVVARIAIAVAPYAAADGSVTVPGSALVARAVP